ncbi:restriction endonuclease subunit S [Bordetella bronchiseptica]|uniref:restriction endonuclease subunit S n=1 Tax=Bordetella bronchiseptica TaxID=518 RepID=UPI003F7466C8
MAADQQITEVVDFNPPRSIKRGAVAPFVDMAALPENQRDIAYVSEREFSGGGSRFQNGDTLFARITPCLENGKTAKVNSLPSGSIAHGSTEFIVMAAKAPEYDEDYVYYLARHPDFRAFAEARMEGTSGRQRVSWQALSGFSFPFPPSDQRRVIGSILRRIDDKIHLNRRINQTLEAMAQAIFKSWFVDFDPVKAKITAIEQGQDPLRAAMRAISGKTDTELDQMPREHHDQLATTAALFPDAMQESELGEIPKGWEVSTIGEMVEIAGGATPDTKNESYWNPPEYFWTSPKDLSGAQSPVLLTTERKISTAGLSRIGSGLLPKGTLLMSSRAPIGYLAITQIPVAINQGYIAMLPGGKLPPLYLLMWCQQNMEEIKGQANGSTFMEISKKAFRPMLVINPGSVVLDRFIETVAPLFGKLAEGVKESSQLAELRDTLLPKLLSGELRVPDAECSMEEV